MFQFPSPFLSVYYHDDLGLWVGAGETAEGFQQKAMYGMTDRMGCVSDGCGNMRSTT